MLKAVRISFFLILALAFDPLHAENKPNNSSCLEILQRTLLPVNINVKDSMIIEVNQTLGRADFLLSGLKVPGHELAIYLSFAEPICEFRSFQGSPRMDVAYFALRGQPAELVPYESTKSAIVHEYGHQVFNLNFLKPPHAAGEFIQLSEVRAMSEVFADLLAVLEAKNLSAIRSFLTPSLDTSPNARFRLRDFSQQFPHQGWRESDTHSMLAPLRSEIGRAISIYDPSFQNVEFQKRLLVSTMNVMNRFGSDLYKIYLELLPFRQGAHADISQVTDDIEWINFALANELKRQLEP